MTKGITLQEIDTSATSRLVIKDSAGRAKVTDPSAADDIALKRTVDNAVGNLLTLQTTDKSNVVKAINELFTNVSDGKNAVAAAITGKGVPASGSDTFAQLAAKIGQIVTGKKYATGNLDSNQQQINVSGLDFKPRMVFVIGFWGINLLTYLPSTSSGGGEYTYGRQFRVNVASPPSITIKDGSQTLPYITDNGFSFEPLSYGGSNTRFVWYAWE